MASGKLHTNYRLSSECRGISVVLTDRPWGNEPRAAKIKHTTAYHIISSTAVSNITSNVVMTTFIQQSSQTAVYNIYTRLTALFPGLPGWAGTRKVKPIWILLKQETVSSSGISWDICKSAPRSRQITTPAPHHSVFYRPDALPATQPTASKHWRQLRLRLRQLRLNTPLHIISLAAQRSILQATLLWPPSFDNQVRQLYTIYENRKRKKEHNRHKSQQNELNTHYTGLLTQHGIWYH